MVASTSPPKVTCCASTPPASSIVNAKWLLDQDGEIKITLPEQVHVSLAAIQAALQPA
jgi:hypothetical protein